MNGPTSTNPVFITLGANINPAANLRRAVRLLGAQLALKRVSRVYESPALDAEGRVSAGQGHFLNAAVLIETDLAPAMLKFDVLRQIEAQMGRIRTSDKYAPRPIDLDIALYGSLVIDAPAPATHGSGRLTIPDPDTLTRAHVALPLADLAPAFIHPLTGQPLAAIAAALAAHASISVSDIDLGAAPAARHASPAHDS